MKTPEILLVDDDPGAIQLMARILSGSGRVRFATNGADALKIAREAPPDLMLLDAEMPGMSGFELCRAIKADPDLARVPVMFVTSHTQLEFELSGFELGAVDFVTKPVSEPVLLARVGTQLRLKHLHDELERISTIDALTQVANRRHFDEVLQREWLRGLRMGSPTSLLMIDVDHFKLFNDRHGHPSGDAALQSVAHALGSVCLRPADLVARYGGEEFVILLPHTPREGACVLAQRAVEAVAQRAIPHGASPSAAHVTVSVGVGCYDDASQRWIDSSGDSAFMREVQRARPASELISAADQALYAAKRAGRNRAFGLDIADVDTPAAAWKILERHALSMETS